MTRMVQVPLGSVSNSATGSGRYSWPDSLWTSTRDAIGVLCRIDETRWASKSTEWPAPMIVATSLSNNDVWVLPREGNGKPYPLLATPFNETRPKFSPDGRWIAYVSNEDGPNQLYVIPFTPPTATGAGEGRLPSARKVRVSTGGAISPPWRRDDGRE